MTPQPSGSPVVRGQLRRLDALGTTSVYEVADDPHGELVAMRVVVAPGLDEGITVRLTVAAVSRMEVVGQTADRRPATATEAEAYG